MENFGDLVSQSSRVLLYAPLLNSFDKASAAIGLIKFLRNEGEDADLVLGKEPEDEIKELLNRYEIEVLLDLKPRNYSISIDYGKTGIEKVVWDKDEKNNKLVFQIVPGEGDFSFDNVEFSEGGQKYDLTIVFGTDELKKIDLLNGENEYLLRENKVVLINRGKGEKGDLFVQVDDDGAFSEAVYNLLQETGTQFDKDTVEILLNGTINHRKILEGNASSNSWGLISSMVGQGADLNKLINNTYYSKSSANLDLQIELMKNVKKDPERRVIWSLVRKNILDKAGLNESTLDLRGRIPFNISGDFDLAIAAYELDSERIKMVVESNNADKYSASVIAGVFDGQGSESHAECDIKGFSANEFEEKIFSILNDLYSTKQSKNIDLKGKSVDKKAKK